MLKPLWPESKYSACDDGHIYIRLMNGETKQLREYPCSRRMRYRMVSFRKEGKQKRDYVHRLVCGCFNGEPPDGKTQVDHIDGDPTNNRPENLRWVTASENIRAAYRTGRYDSFICLDCGQEIVSRNRTRIPLCHNCANRLLRAHVSALKAQRKTEALSESLCTAAACDARDTGIIEMRRSGCTLQQIGDEYGITRERVRQILSKYN